MSKYKDIEKIKVQLSNIETFLLKSNFINENKLQYGKIDQLNQIISKKDYLSNFEFNEKISFSEASVKYGDLIQSINKLFSSNLTIQDMYEQYINLTKDEIQFNQYLNSLILINIFFSNLSFIIGDDKINCENIEVYDVCTLDSDKNALKNKIEEMNKIYGENSSFKGNNINYNLIILVFIITMGNSYFIDKDLPDLKYLMIYFIKYNNIYINNLNISILLYFITTTIINLYLNSIKNKKIFLNYEKLNINEKLYIEFNDNENAPEINNNENINPNLYLYDNENISFKKEENDAVKILIFQNYLKLYSLYYLNKNKIKYTINLYIGTIFDLLLHINNYQKSNENESLEENIFNNISEDNTTKLFKLNLTKINLFQKDNIINTFSSFNFYDLSIFVTGFQNDFQISKIIIIYLNLIKKSRNLFLQESSLIKKTNADNSKQEFSTQNLIEYFSILYYILDSFCKSNNLKKNYPFLILIKFNFMKCTINRNKKKENIQIYFDYSCIKEKTLFHFFKSFENILFLISKYNKIIALVHELKIYNCTFRISQTNFISHQLNFYFKLITKSIIEYIESKKYSKIEIYEKKLSNYNPNLLIYIKDINQSKKNRLFQIKQMISNPLYFSKIKIFNYLIEQLESNFDVILISNNINEFQLLRTFDDNKIFIYLNKEIHNNNLNENSKGTLTNSLIETYEYINIILYFKNDQEIYKKGMDFMNLLKSLRKSSQENVLLPYKTTLICDRYFLESKVIVDKTMENYIFSLYENIDELLLIAKSMNNNMVFDSFNYDVYINKKYINVCNYHKYNAKTDIKYQNLIYDFISCISSCIELIIYILKYKEISINKFVYIIRTADNVYYSFEYKNSNIFFKKIKEFESLILLNLKKCFPLFCLISNKKESDYMESNGNFLDVFLRLFLNLNKVAENKENLVQLFLQKIHKSIFYQYYENYDLIGFNYEALNTFNNFLTGNEYWKICEGDKFNKCDIIPIHIMNNTEKNNYKILIQNFLENENKENNLNICKRISIFNYGFNNNYIYKNFDNIEMSFNKIEYYKKIQEGLINSNMKDDINKKNKYLYQKIKKTKLSKKIFLNIVSFIKNKNISTYNSDIKLYEELLNDYKTERINYKAQNVGKRIQQRTEIAKLGASYNDNNCIIF